MSEEFNPNNPDLDDREYERRIEREVIYITPDEEAEAAPEETEAPTPEELQKEAEAEARREERQKQREANPFWQFISGNWLILEGTTGTYRYLLIIAATLFLSVVSIFYSFHLSERYALREKSVQLLKERSLEFQSARFNATSHSAIVKELRRRRIPLYDMQESKTIIEK